MRKESYAEGIYNVVSSITLNLKMEPIILVDELTKQFGDFIAVDNLSFSIEKGEVLGLLGPNGAGKTTTVRLLTGLLRPTKGNAHIVGFDLSQIRYVKHQIGFLPESSNLYEELTVRQNLVFVAQLYGVPRDERVRRISELLQVMELEDRGDMLFRKLSKGLRRRVALAAALIHQPTILVLDEPTVGLDVFSRHQLHQIIGSLHEDGRSILLTTHYIEEAEAFCDHVLILNKGRRIAFDKPSVLIKQTSTSNLEEAFLKITGLPIEHMWKEKE